MKTLKNQTERLIDNTAQKTINSWNRWTVLYGYYHAL